MSAETSTPTIADLAVRCPEGWTAAPLLQPCDVRFSSVDKLTSASEIPVRLCNYTDVYSNDYITQRLEFMSASATHTEIERFGLKVGDVIITKDSETPDDIGIPAVVDEAARDLLCGYHLALIRPRSSDIDSTFLAKQLGHDRLASYFGRQANGLTRYSLPLAAVQKTPLWLPSPDEQKMIGALLRSVDQAIAKSSEVVAKLKQVRLGFVHDLLTRGLDENGQVRDASDHPEQFSEAAAGLIPSAWRWKPLGEAAEWFSGGTPSRAESSFWSGLIPFLTPKDMKTLDLTDTIEHVSQQGVHAGSRIMPEETVFVVVRGMILAHTFPVCISARPFAFNQDIKAVRGRDGLCNRFLAHWFAANSWRFLRMANDSTHGTKKLDLNELVKVQIACPRPEEQQEIVKRIRSFDLALATEEAELAKLRAVNSGFTADLLNGCVRVSETLLSAEANA